MKQNLKQVPVAIIFVIVINLTSYAQQSGDAESNQADKIISSQHTLIKQNSNPDVWSSLGPNGISASDLALDPFNNNKIIAASSAGMFITTNGGQNWNIANTSFYNVTVNKVKFHPTNSTIVIAICADNITGDKYITRSTNGGSSWTIVKTLTAINNYGKIVFVKSNPNIIYIMGYYLLKSTDAGANWTEYQSLPNIGEFDVFDQDPNKLYASATNPTTSIHEYFTSLDGGNSWVKIGITPFYITCIKISPTDFNLIYAGSTDLPASGGYGFLKSTDGGNNWTSTTVGWGIISKIYRITLHPDNQNIIYACGSVSGLMKSTNAGLTWTKIMTNLNDNYVFCVEFDMQRNLYVGTGGNIYKTINEITYQSLSGNLVNTGVFQLCVHPTIPGIIYVSTLGGVLKSTDGGQNWFQKSKGIDDTDDYSLGINPQIPNILFAGSLCGLVYRTTDSGENWLDKTNGLPGLSGYSINDFIFHPQNVNSVFVSTGSSKTFISTNSGDSWVEYKINNNTESIRFLDISPSSNNVWYAYNATGGKLYRSSDYGSNWILKKTALYLYSIFIDANTPDILYADQSLNSTHNISKSTDGGVTWNVLCPNMYIKDIHSIAGSPNILYASTSGSGVLKSANGGSTWDQMNTGLTYLNCNMVRSQTGNTNSFWVATYGGSVFGYNYTPTEIVQEETIIANKYILYNNYPNPFNPTTKISYSVPLTSFVTLKVFDLMGREVSTLVNEQKSPGKYEVEFNGSNLSSGIYFYRISSGNFSQTKRLVLIK